MPDTAALIAAWARSAVAPHGGAFRHLHAHEIGAPVLKALLERAGIPANAVDAVVMGNALGAGGNPARMVALAAGYRTAALRFLLTPNAAPDWMQWLLPPGCSPAARPRSWWPGASKPGAARPYGSTAP